jgi:hypothetical protein
MDLREIEWDDIEWIGLAQDRDQWKALVNTVMNLWGFHKILGSSLVSAQLAASREGLSSMSKFVKYSILGIVLIQLLNQCLLTYSICNSFYWQYFLLAKS